jgi:hypothetical protein
MKIKYGKEKNMPKTATGYSNNIRYSLIHSFTGAYSPGWTFGLRFRGFLITHIEIHGGTPLDE